MAAVNGWWQSERWISTFSSGESRTELLNSGRITHCAGLLGNRTAPWKLLRCQCTALQHEDGFWCVLYYRKAGYYSSFTQMCQVWLIWFMSSWYRVTEEEKAWIVELIGVLTLCSFFIRAQDQKLSLALDPFSIVSLQG